MRGANITSGKTKIFIGIAIFVVFIIAASLAYKTLTKDISPQGSINSSAGDDPAVTEEKIAAPDFTVLDSEGNSVKLSELVGKPIVLNFWASWCPPCKQEMPDFNKAYEDIGEDITFVMVDMVDGQRETMEKGKEHITDNKYTFPVYYDTKQEAANTYGVSGLPTTYFIDKDGFIVTGAQGAIDEKTLLKGIEMIK